MRVVFVHLGREHLGIEYLSAVIKQKGHDARLAYDPGLFGENDNVFYVPRLERLFDRSEAMVREIARLRPDVAAIAAYTNTYAWALRMARRIKEEVGCPVVMGGSHPTLVPGEVAKSPHVDFTIEGEAEGAFLDLIEAIGAGERDFAIPNVWRRKDGRIVSTPKRPPIADIDAIPFPDKTLFEKEVNIADDYIVLTSRGCVLSCTFCCENYINKTYGHAYYRRRSVENVMAELRLAKSRYGFREVMFNDAIFFTDKDWLRRLAPLYKREIGVPFRCFGQVKFIDREVGEILRDMGCYCIEYGVQTLNEAVRNFVLARTESNVENTHAMAICDKYGIRYDVDHIFGLPEEREEDFVQAARYYRRRRYLNRIKCHNLTYFPQTEMVEIARGKGLIDDAEVERINRGEVGDFFHGRTVERDDADAWARRYQTLFKVLPVLPAFALEWLLRDGRLRHLERLPAPAVILGQILVAIRGRDYRFVLYVKYYFWRLRRWAALRWLPERT